VNGVGLLSSEDLDGGLLKRGLLMTGRHREFMRLRAVFVICGVLLGDTTVYFTAVGIFRYSLGNSGIPYFTWFSV
jgi:hypothetical protein